MCIFVIYKTKKLINIAYLRKELRTKTTLGELEELFAKSSPDALCAIFSEVKGFLCVLLLFFNKKKILTETCVIRFKSHNNLLPF